MRLLLLLLFPVLVWGQTVRISGDDGRPLDTSNGGIPVDLTGLIAGENQTLDVLDVNAGATYKQVTATGAIKASAGALVGFFLASTTSCTVQLHDDPDSATAPIVLNTTAALTVLGWYPLPATFATGLYFTEGGTCDITFVYH